MAKDQSTFFVEMSETADILANATNRSLVVMDEIGRGTSSVDGLALAQAIMRHIHDDVQCRLLFATHYHELGQDTVGLGGMAHFQTVVKLVQVPYFVAAISAV